MWTGNERLEGGGGTPKILMTGRIGALIPVFRAWGEYPLLGGKKSETNGDPRNDSARLLDLAGNLDKKDKDQKRPDKTRKETKNDKKRRPKRDQNDQKTRLRQDFVSKSRF